jgi:hypothetical protein
LAIKKSLLEIFVIKKKITIFRQKVPPDCLQIAGSLNFSTGPLDYIRIFSKPCQQYIPCRPLYAEQENPQPRKNSAATIVQKPLQNRVTNKTYTS